MHTATTPVVSTTAVPTYAAKVWATYYPHPTRVQVCKHTGQVKSVMCRVVHRHLYLHGAFVCPTTGQYRVVVGRQGMYTISYVPVPSYGLSGPPIGTRHAHVQAPTKWVQYARYTYYQLGNWLAAHLGGAHAADGALAALLAVGIDAGMVASELAALLAHGTRAQHTAGRWAQAYITAAVLLSVLLNAYAFGRHAAPGMVWAAWVLGAVIPLLVYALGRVAGHLWLGE